MFSTVTYNLIIGNRSTSLPSFEVPEGLQKDIAKVCHALGVHVIVNVSFFTDNADNAFASSETEENGRKTGYLDLPYHFLIDPEQIPEKYKNKMDFTESELQEFFRESREGYGVPAAEFDLRERAAAEFFLKICQNPALARKARLFIIGHELSHIKHEHSALHPKIRTPFLIFLAALAIGFGIGLTLWHFDARHFSNLHLSLGKIGASVGSTLGIVGVALYGIYCSHLSHRVETEADRTYSRLSEDAIEGGIYLFETLKEINKKMRTLSWKAWFACTEEGDLRFNPTHPSLHRRLETLKKLKQERGARNNA